MAIFRTRFSSFQDIILVFATCTFLVYTWSLLSFLDRLPRWLLYLNAWEIVSILAYILAFAFLESGAVLLILLLIAAVVPKHLFRDKFVAIGSASSTLAAAWTIATLSVPALRTASDKRVLLWLGFCLAVSGVLYLVIYRQPRLQAFTRVFAERVSVLLYVYIPLSLISLVIILLRNVV